MQQGMKQEEIYGRRLWNLLHSTAAYYPDEPSEQDKQAARQFIDFFMRDGIEYREWGEKFMDHAKS